MPPLTLTNKMVASPEEGASIVKIMLRFLDVDLALGMMEDVWEEVGKKTDNESLRDSIILLRDYLEGQWEYSLPIQNDTQSQDSGL